MVIERNKAHGCHFRPTVGSMGAEGASRFQSGVIKFRRSEGGWLQSG